MIYLILCLYALADGLNNAVLYSRKGAGAFKWNEHLIFIAQRGAPYLTVIPAAWYGSQVDSLLSLCILILVEWFAAALAFSFFHNGIYAEARDRIAGDVYDLRYNWKYSSATDTSSVNFTYKERLWMFVTSVVLLAVVYFMLAVDVL